MINQLPKLKFKQKNPLEKNPSISNIKFKDELSLKLQVLFEDEYELIYPSLLQIDIDCQINLMANRVEQRIQAQFNKTERSNKEVSNIIQSNQSKLRKWYQENFELFSQKWNSYLLNPNEFNELASYRKHCPKTSQFAYHKCKTTSQYCISKLIEVSLNEKEVTHVICIKCKEIYSAKEIKLFCSNCNINYYSSVIGKNERVDLLPATWKTYHCKRAINEKMKCIKCFHVLYLNLNTLMVNCINPRCLFIDDPLSIIWKCAICQLDFKSEATIFNPLEALVYQKAIKFSLLSNIKAKPLYDCCDLTECKKEEGCYKHGRKCGGLLYSGELNNQKMVVCGKCKAIFAFATFIWKCPICNRKFSSKNKNKIETTTVDVSLDKCKSNKGTNPIKMMNLLGSDALIEQSKNQKTHQPFAIYPILSKSDRISTGAAKKEHNTNPFMIAEDVEETEHNIVVKEEPYEDNEEEGYYEYLHRVNKIVNEEIDINEFLNDQIIPSFDGEEYQTIKRIGQGSYANIYDILHNETGKHFAMKKIITNDLGDVRKYKTEFELVYLNPHPHVVQIYNMSIRQLDFSTYSICVLMELAESDWDTQIKYYRNINKEYKEEDLIIILKQLTSALSYLQSKGISHRDIKPQNILIFPSNVYKLSDFGEAKSIQKAKNMNTLKGTEMFMSPSLFKALHSNEGEVLHNSYKSDVYSIGLCFLYALTFNFNVIETLRKEEGSSNTLLKKFKLSFNYTYMLSKMISRSERDRFDFVSLEDYLTIFDN